MTFENICGIVALKDSQVKAYIEVCLEKQKKDDRITIGIIQTLATSYAQNLTQTFMEANREFLSDESNRLNLRKYLVSRGADKGHSGNRFSEELYLVLPGKIIEKEEEKE